MPPKTAPEGAGAKNLREYLATSGLKWKESQTSYIFTCPRCQKPEKLWMFKETGRFICFYCAEIDGFKGRPEFALSDLLGVNVGEVRKDLYGDSLPPAELFFDPGELENWYSDDDFEDGPPDLEALQTRLWPPDCFPIISPLAQRGRDYLAGRGIPLDLAMAYNIHYSGPQTRVCFPVEYRGKLYGWQGRFIGTTDFFNEETGKKKTIPKVLTTPGLKKDQTVMFADRLERTDQIIICEGPVDAIKCHYCTPELGRSAGNVATMGKAVSQAQVNLIKYSGVKRIYLALDPDAAAEMERLVRSFMQYAEVYFMAVPLPYKDFGEMPCEEVVDAYRQARLLDSSVVFASLTREHQMAHSHRLAGSR